MNNGYKARMVPGIRAVFVGLMLGLLGINTAYAFGFACAEGKAPLPHNKKKCVPCGHKGEPACEALRKGPECFDYTQKINGICEARGGQGEKQYKKGLGFIGFDCKPGYQKDPNRKGYCTACGELHQPSCEAARKGPACAEGLKPKKIGNSDQCVLDTGIESQLKRRATEEIMRNLQAVVDLAIKAINERTHKSSVRASVASYKKGKKVSPGSGTATAVQPLVLHGAAGPKSLHGSSGGGFMSWTLGTGADAVVGLGVSVETGLAFPLAGGGQKGFTQFSTDFQLGIEATGGVTAGLSTNAYNKQGGKSLGYRMSVASVIQVVKGLKDLAELVEDLTQLEEVHPDLVIGVWFDRAAGGHVGSFQGITATVGAAAGLGLGATYSRAQTWQF